MVCACQLAMGDDSTAWRSVAGTLPVRGVCDMKVTIREFSFFVAVNLA